MRWLTRMILPIAATVAMLVGAPQWGLAADFVVYSVYKGLDMGNPGEVPQKDFYVNMGSAQGLHDGSQLDVLRKIATYDLLNEKLYKDVTFPIARIKVIHVEENAAVCRLEKTLAPERTPATASRSVMVGDLVRQAD